MKLSPGCRKVATSLLQPGIETAATLYKVVTAGVDKQTMKFQGCCKVVARLYKVGISVCLPVPCKEVVLISEGT